MGVVSDTVGMSQGPDFPRARSPGKVGPRRQPHTAAAMTAPAKPLHQLAGMFNDKKYTNWNL